MIRYPLRLAVLSLLTLVLAGAPVARAGDGEAPDGRNFVQRLLANVRLGEGVQANQVTVFPIVVTEDPAVWALLPDTKAPKVSYQEPEFPRHRYNLEVMNGEADPVLLLGGTVLAGGLRDRLVPHSTLLPPGKTIEIETLPAAAAADERGEAIPFQVSAVLAPPYLQEEALFSPSANLVPMFVTHFYDFRNAGDERKSLVAINDSDLLTQYCLVCHRTLAAFPQPKEPRQQVIGGVTAVRGRVQSLAIFGTNDLLRAWFEPMLKGHSFAAAAIELRAKKAGIPIPGKDDADATLAAVRDEAQKLLERLLLARYKPDDLAEGELGEALLLRTGDGTRGRALALDGRLLHLVVFPHDPFERALYSRALNPPDADLMSDPERDGVAELARRAATQGQRLTEAERRLLERLGRGYGQGQGNLPGAETRPGGQLLPPGR